MPVEDEFIQIGRLLSGEAVQPQVVQDEQVWGQERPEGTVHRVVHSGLGHGFEEVVGAVEGGVDQARRLGLAGCRTRTWRSGVRRKDNGQTNDGRPACVLAVPASGLLAIPGFRSQRGFIGQRVCA